MFPSLRFSVCFVGLTAAGLLAGCGAAGLFPDSAPLGSATALSTPGALQGSNYGGHAPIVGAHVYLVQPGTTGYGSVEKGLLSATYNTNTAQTANELFPTTQNGSWSTTLSGNASDQFVPSADSSGNPFYGVTTDNAGNFNVTGDYTCTVGQPVFLIAYGGSASYVGQGSGSTVTAQTNTFPISSIQVSNLAGQGGGTGTATYTFNIGGTTPELFYVGEQVTIAGTSLTANPGGSSTFFNGTTLTVTGTNLSTTSFQTTFTGDYGGYPTATSPYFPAQTTTQPAGATVTANPPFNPATVNMAMLGICPSAGNFSTGATKLPFVYMNEISTAALAYAMNQYMNWSVSDQSGNDEFHIGAPSTAQAQQGIVNAAINAGHLYDITGSNQSTSFAGEGHIARAQTASGAGIVPQAELDTVGNILAACVDSLNTYRLGNGIVSSQCNTLETYATDNGVYDSTVNIMTGTYTHVSFNTAQAAFNIAHYPAGNGTGTTSGGVQTVTAGTATSASNFANALFNLPTGNVPFVPQLTTAPNDFSVGINWQTSPYATSCAVAGCTPSGSTTDLTSIGEVAIDSLGNAWFPNNVYLGGSQIWQLSPSGFYSLKSPVSGTANGTTYLAGMAIDTSNNVYISSTAGVQELSAASGYSNVAATSGIIGYVDGNNYFRNVTANAGQIAVDNSGNLYAANQNLPNPPVTTYATTSSLVKEPVNFTSTTATWKVAGTGANPNTAGGCSTYLGLMTLDASGNVWTSNQGFAFGNAYDICKFNNSGTLLWSYSYPTVNSAMAIDKGGNAWWAEYTVNTIGEALSTATSASGVQGAATLYSGYASTLTGPRAIAVDGKNTIWIGNNYLHGSIAQMSDTGVLMSPTFYTGVGFGPNSGSGASPTVEYMAIDQSGDVWVPDIGGTSGGANNPATPTGKGQLIEWIGIAAPTVQPLAQQRLGTATANGHGIGQLP